MKVAFVIKSSYGVERLGVQILISIAKGLGFEIFLFHDLQDEKLIHRISELEPEVIAYSAMTYEHYGLQELNKKLKSKISFVSVFGGSHYTFNPEEIEFDSNIDIICVGEGENAFCSLLEHLKEKTDYSNISNLIVRNNGLHRNQLAPLANLDKVPFPDRASLSLDARGYRFMGKTCFIMISRGCPYQCTYCFNSTYNKIYNTSKVRWRSVSNVIAEMEKIRQEISIDYFSIIDDSFNLLPKEYIYEFCKVYKERIGLPFSAGFRADLCEEDIIKALKDAGMSCATCGVETGDEDVAKKVLKRNLTNDQIVNAFRMFSKYKIKCFSQNIVGLPVEDPVRNALKTIELNRKCNVDYAHFTLLIPFPKTPIEKYCREKGYLGNYPKDLSPSVFSESILKFKSSKVNREINNLHKFCSLAVQYTFLLPVIKLLIKLPPNRIFQYVYFIWYGYCNTVKLYDIKFSFYLIFSGMKQISNYLKKNCKKP